MEVLYSLPMTSHDKQILHIALPAIISNITVPLLGMVDMAIIGHIGDAAYLGAIAVGSMLFNVVYWLFGFLRMGTGGLTSQAFGRQDTSEEKRILLRSLAIAALIGFLFILLQLPVRNLAFRLLGATPQVSHLAARYYAICVWGAPAVLGLYSMTGWFLGMQNTRFPMFISIIQNIVNILCSLLFVFGLKWKIEGVAWGTVIAQYIGFSLALLFYLRGYKFLHSIKVNCQDLLDWTALQRFFVVNRDIFLRTLCLVAVTLYFTSVGARQGDLLLAVNALLMQLFTLYSYFMDGFAYAGEAICGRYIGARQRIDFYTTIRHLFIWGGALMILFTVIYALAGNLFITWLTDDIDVQNMATTYMPWVIGIPLAGMAAFLLDGVFIGSTATRSMLISMAVATIIFFSTYHIFSTYIANHALWMAFLLYLITRGALLALYLPQLYNKQTRTD